MFSVVLFLPLTLHVSEKAYEILVKVNNLYKGVIVDVYFVFNKQFL